MGWFDGNTAKSEKGDAVLEKDLKAEKLDKTEAAVLATEGGLVSINNSSAQESESGSIPSIDDEELPESIDHLVEKKEEESEPAWIETPKEREWDFESDEVAVEVPTESLEKLINTKGMVPLSIHGNSLLLNVNEIDELLGEGTLTDSRLKILQRSLESVLSNEDAGELAEKQRQSISSGVKFSLEEHNPILSLSSYKIIVPEFISKVQVEELDKEVELGDYSVLVEVKPEYREEALGLPKVITTSVAVKILNDVSKLSTEEEFRFYCQLLPHMKPDSHTVQYALNLLRMIMQYSINVDTLELKAVLTREVLKHGE